jgi:uncharacterized protein
MDDPSDDIPLQSAPPVRRPEPPAPHASAGSGFSSGGTSGAAPPEPPASALPGIESDPNARNLAMLAHLLGIVSGFVGPLLIWVLKKDTHPFVEDQAKEALNFQITIALAYFVLSIMMWIWWYFWALFPLLSLANLALCLLAAVQASNGERFRYPVALRLVK